MIIRDSIIKHLRHENLSPKNNEVEIAAHPGLATKGMLGYIKLVVRKKSDLLVIHNGVNDFTNGVIKMKDLRKLAKCVREVDKDQ